MMAKKQVSRFNKRVFAFLLPVALLLCGSIIFRITNLDLLISGNFFSHDHGWFLDQTRLIQALYHYGPFPALAIGLFSLVGFIISFFLPCLIVHRTKFLFLLCLLLIGPGLIINVCFKEHWGRPRPREIVNFGGNQPFLPVLEKGSGTGKSFPSGHASMGFYFVAPYFVLRKRAPQKGLLFLGTGLGYGLLMGFGRIAQGGHFASDIMWSAGFVYLSGLVLSWLIQFKESSRPTL